MTKNNEIVNAVSSAEYWADLITDLLWNRGPRFDDLLDWLHSGGNGGDGHRYFENVAPDAAHSCCIHLFDDRSILECDTGRVLTFEAATDRMDAVGNNEALRALWDDWLVRFEQALRDDEDDGEEVEVEA